MKPISLAANERELIKTIGSKKLRNSGRIPGTLYGGGDPANIEIASAQFEKAIKSTEAKNFLVELDLNGTKSMALVQDLQKHPISNLCIHVDFRRLTNDSIITAKIPLHTTGTPEGVKVGGILQTMSHNLTLKGKALDIPESVDLDTSHLQVGDGILLEAVSLPEGVASVGDPKSRIVAVAASRITAKAEESSDAEADKSVSEASSSEESKSEENKEA